MSFLYRPTPVLSVNPAPVPPRLNPVWKPIAGTMRGYQENVNWKAFFDEARRACAGKPWIHRSGAMGRFDLSDRRLRHLSGLGDDSTDVTDLPLPTDIGGSLTSMALPQSFFDLTAPAAPDISTPNMAAPDQNLLTGGAGTPQISSAGSPLISSLPASPANPSSPTALASITSSLANLGTSITKAVTGTPAAVPNGTTASASLATAQGLVAQANAIAATNPSLAATYLAQANALVPGIAGSTSLSSWLSANGTWLMVGVAVLVGLGLVMKK